MTHRKSTQRTVSARTVNHGFDSQGRNLLAALMLVSFGAAQTWADVPPQSGKTQLWDTSTFEEADRNSNGVLDKQEADHVLVGFEIPDLNRDGKVNKREVKVVLPDVAFKEDDKGHVTADEYRMILQAMERREQRWADVDVRESDENQPEF